MTGQLTVSYGLLLHHSRNLPDNHILPITKIVNCTSTDGYCFLTCGRDGSVIRHKYTSTGKVIESKRMQTHSDWVTDVLEVNSSQFITVSHDFSIVLHTINVELDTWETKIIGDHDDYIKCITHIPNYNSIKSDDYEDSFVFVTAGLDRKIKVWSLKDSEAELLHTFDNAQKKETGSIYSIAAVDNPNIPYDLIVGDNNGDLILYSCSNQRELARIKRAHKTNIKVVKILDHFTKLFSTSSDGIIRVWDISEENRYIPTKISSWEWNHPVWCVFGNSISQLFIGDSEGNISTNDFSTLQNASTANIFDGSKYLNSINDKISTSDRSKKTMNKHSGILGLALMPNSNSLLFSFSTNSNLNQLNFPINTLNVVEGGIALTRSSLLTNRRHVITENTRGEIQRWDIISCKLVNTFDDSEGSFDEVVVKYTSKEILSHWCSVSIKVGLLFVKLNQKFLSTEVYGSALNEYNVLNGIELNTDERYNLGKIMVNSLFNEFMEYEIQKDKLIRKSVATKKKDSFFNAQKENNNGKVYLQEYDNPLEKRFKEKKRKSHFMKFGLGSPTSPSTLSSSNPEASVYDSNPSTMDDAETSIILDEQQSVPPSAMASTDKLVSDELTTSKSTDNRSLSTGYILNKRLKFFGSNSKSSGAATNTVNEGLATPDSPFSTPDEGKEDTPNISMPLTNYSKDFSGIPQLRKNSSDNNIKTIDTSLKSLSLSDTNQVSKNKYQYMSDLLIKIEEGYKQQFNANSSSLKLLTRKLPDSKITRDTTSPILRIRNGTLLVVHKWGEDACGGRVIFSTFLPSTSPVKENYYEPQQENEDFMDSHIGEDEKLGKFDFIDYEYGGGMSRRQIFENLEQNLPYWFATALFEDSKVAKEQPKLTFTIAVWKGSVEQIERNNSNSDESLTSSKPSYQNRLKFKRTKSSDFALGASDLPKVSEYNSKLIATSMIKVKKIKTSIVERFDSKTPEMKSKMDPSDWLELLCKGQILDNDMTLGTIRTLYWKSQGEIALEFRRKITTTSIETSSHSTTNESN